jgi:hypothetical protein
MRTAGTGEFTTMATLLLNYADSNANAPALFYYPTSIGQQSYQDYHCSPEEAHMECKVDPNMSLVGVTHAKVIN